MAMKLLECFEFKNTYITKTPIVIVIDNDKIIPNFDRKDGSPLFFKIVNFI
ncbi:hypothetical protein DDB_G0287283 [Dictyostelium discoideum AX4]|uniref:Putative uncharacterized protein DDB_G0287283 n=1 Tax=Dictyostelium discoideum TaxID=44689 RepID=Y7397_DICDI|nr:hypothetical protein DDB_G0287283 [Dictyostelium discoideum AX4]Q54KK8.1 RecName: Full=Putative uncharacterized protein DDB_G0287283 [Dictyostelium discoideum]EAL63803.1 hypothetical protein DDB_G0287283 [Dictyostelium discoideum AX4]|eukprot:XP_637309.1 hypothetical protein DDB_G0287283 [Dictyostelium discoideum AX4]